MPTRLDLLRDIVESLGIARAIELMAESGTPAERMWSGLMLLCLDPVDVEAAVLAHDPDLYRAAVESAGGEP